MPARKKRKGTIALAAAANLLALEHTLDADEARVFTRNITRWLDNGHNLDADDVEWLAGESCAAVAAMRAAGTPIR